MARQLLLISQLIHQRSMIPIVYLNKNIVPSSKMSIDSFYFFGDSITYGMSAGTGLDYASKTSQYFNVVKNNLAVSSTTLSNSYYPNSFRDTCSSIVPNKGSMKSFIIIAHGTNDGRSEHPFLTTPYNTPAIYNTQFQEVLDIIYSKGWLKSEIILVTPFYVDDTDLATYSTDRLHYEVYVQKLKDVAMANGITYYDAYNEMINNGGNSLLSSDHVHPNNTGHDVIFLGLKNILNTKINVKP